MLNGRQAEAGSPAAQARTRMASQLLKTPTVIGASEPPAIMISAPPALMVRNASPTAWAEEAQAVDMERQWPRARRHFDTWLVAALCINRGIVNGCMRRFLSP